MPRRQEETAASPVGGLCAAPVDVEARGGVELVPVLAGFDAVEPVGLDGVALLGPDEAELGGVEAVELGGLDALALDFVNPVELAPAPWLA
jgi:hypothetical protein